MKRLLLIAVIMTTTAGSAPADQAPLGKSTQPTTPGISNSSGTVIVPTILVPAVICKVPAMGPLTCHDEHGLPVTIEIQEDLELWLEKTR